MNKRARSWLARNLPILVVSFILAYVFLPGFKDMLPFYTEGSANTAAPVAFDAPGVDVSINNKVVKNVDLICETISGRDPTGAGDLNCRVVNGEVIPAETPAPTPVDYTNYTTDFDNLDLLS